MMTSLLQHNPYKLYVDNENDIILEQWDEHSDIEVDSFGLSPYLAS